MKFDVIIGNPPYQSSVIQQSSGNANAADALPVYQDFALKAMELGPEHLVMITPSRWFSGGKSQLARFRKTMIEDRHLKVLVDHPDSAYCFPGVKIEGGVSYFLWSASYQGDCTFVSRQLGRPDVVAQRDLRDGDGIITRDVAALVIIEKVQSGGVDRWCSDVVKPNRPFGGNINTNFSGAGSEPFDGSIPLLFGDHVGYVRPDQIQRHIEWVDQHKVLIPMAYGAGNRLPHAVIGEPIALAPGSACTQTYLVAGVFDDAEQAKNYAEYLCTKFVRFLVLQRKTTQHVKPDKFKFVPMLDMSRPWADAQLYDEFDLTPEERDYIEAMIKPRSPILSLDSPIPATHLPGGRKHKSKES